VLLSVGGLLLKIRDEPLNFIDIISRIQIEELILEYLPTLLFVEQGVPLSLKFYYKRGFSFCLQNNIYEQKMLL